ncbi:MAG: hypothetical protein KJ804_16085 [Proteobacteria bacterium]|nr:hypothetical protein [Pseudomonadota bacterium]MBU1059831.1 hypothetical protein [Pseudomonadota bacterium]
MIPKTVILLSLLLASCQQFSALDNQYNHPPEAIEDPCHISSDEILSCIVSSKQLSTKDLNSEFDALINFIESESSNTKLNRLLCLTLHHDASKKQLQRGKDILEKIIKNNKCRQKNLTGLLLLIQGNLDLHEKYINKASKLQLEQKKLLKKNETLTLELDEEIISSQRRIEDLEQQVQKLKEIESMVDKKMSP